MSYIFLPDAQEEFFEAALRYEQEEPGLGERFRIDIERLIAFVLQNPELHPKRRGGYRRINSSKFPHYIAYYVRAQTIIIAAVAHGYRKPGYWKTRLG